MRVPKQCKSCGQPRLIHGHGMCIKCYSQDYRKKNKEKIKQQRKKWWPSYYQKTKERQLAYSTQYVKTEKYKRYKREYDKKRRDLLRFNGNRNKALSRAGFKCEICNSQEELHIHHIDGKSYHNNKFPNNDINNLMVLCEDCHYNKFHKKRKPTSADTKQKISIKKRQRDTSIFLR